MRKEQIFFSFVTVDNHGQNVEENAGTAWQYSFEIGGGQMLEMVALPGGEFLMGSPEGEGYEDEKPRHGVQVRPFLIGRFSITQAQWTAVMGEEKALRFAGPNHAMHDVAWAEAVEFCERLTAVTGHPFRLPSEAEWEYACRGGTTTAFSCGPTITTDLANYNGIYTYLDAPEGPYRHVLLDVDTFPPNPFGLQEMHGNLWEWCADPWHENYEGAPGDGSVWEAGGNERYRVVRGGSWHETPDLCRSALRLKLLAAQEDEQVGVRVVSR